MSECNKKEHWENLLIFGECWGSCGMKKEPFEADKIADAQWEWMQEREREYFKYGEEKILEE